jgi:hypothetical protein
MARFQGGVFMTLKLTVASESRKAAAEITQIITQNSGPEVAQELVVEAIRRDSQQAAGDYLRESVAPFGGE